MAKKEYCYEYPRPSVTVDIVLVTREDTPRVLLIRRKKDPHAGKWAIPGGFIEMDETLEESARRELLEETGLKAGTLEQLHTFGDPDRDPRGRVISVTFLGRIDPEKMQVQAADDAADAQWFPLHRLPPLAFDHRAILTMAKKLIGI